MIFLMYDLMAPVKMKYCRFTVHEKKSNDIIDQRQGSKFEEGNSGDDESLEMFIQSYLTDLQKPYATHEVQFGIHRGSIWVCELNRTAFESVAYENSDILTSRIEKFKFELADDNCLENKALSDFIFSHVASDPSAKQDKATFMNQYAQKASFAETVLDVVNGTSFN